MTAQDARQYAPASERNREPILEVLLQVLPESGTILTSRASGRISIKSCSSAIALSGVPSVECCRDTSSASVAACKC